MKTKMSKKERYQYCPTCNNNPTHVIHKINRVPFCMPLSIKDKVERGECLVCCSDTTSSYSLKDPPEEQMKLPPSSTCAFKTECSGDDDKLNKTMSPPKFKSDRDALNWFRMQQQAKQQQQQLEKSSTQSKSKSIDGMVQADQIPIVSSSVHEAAKQQTTGDEKESSPSGVVGRERTSQLRVKVTTNAVVNKKQSAYITLDLDPASPPSSAEKAQPTVQQLVPRKKSKDPNNEKNPMSSPISSTRSNNKRSNTQQSHHQQKHSTRTSKRSKPSRRIEGTQTQFHKIMKRNNAASKEMLQSLLVAAVLSRKNNQLSGSNEYFLGSDGRYYPDLRANFGKYANLKQCAVCKQRVQGAYYCRLKHCHLEVPDYDGAENSAECLKELFRKSVDELEKIQRYYAGEEDDDDDCNTAVLNSREGGGRTRGGKNGREWSMDQLNDDLLQHVASYIPTLRELIMFCATSKRSQSILTRDSAQSESLLRGIYLNKYGERGAQGNYDIHMTWRERWIMIQNLKCALQHWPRKPTSAELAAAALKLGLQSGDPNSAAAPSSHLRSSIGVLSEHDERSAIYYDNQHLNDDPEADTCNGYFGMHILELAPPPNVIGNWQPPVLLHGDFNGIKIFNSLQDATVRREEEDPTQGTRFISLGDDLAGGQVLSIIHCDYARDDSATDSICCFLGYASGRVAAVTATLSEDNQRYNFQISAHDEAHQSEVTSFTFAKVNNETTILFSACCGGAIRYYPNALKSGENFNLESVLAFNNYYQCPIFSLTSTVVKSTENNSFHILCTGDRDGKVRLWSIEDDFNASPGKKFRPLGQYNSSTHIGTGFHLVTKAKFINENVLVTGTNQGAVRIWCLECKESPGRNIGKGLMPKLNLRFDLMGQHSGSVEVCTNIGDVLFTSGGDDGKMIGWDINSGMKIGPALSCHPGKPFTRLLDDGGEVIHVHSSVIDFVLNVADGKMISLCRDGTLAEWSFSSPESDESCIVESHLN